ncbi:unnamed protein product [Psylliodes chrysocephalus]|uniref:Mitochondrial inner membrane protein Mpv17 n=1 Tax=Psylliodes chrysocephalus TaxID=3402493 RepID=A0A9P0CUN2_9CUCU|nr:unnamed protein product [Psylliodes chrysocephala]
MKFIRFRSSAKFHFAKNKLFRTHSIQTCILMGTGDAIAQTVVEKTDYNQFDFRRTLKFAFVGLIFVGPVLTTWYTFLNTTLPHSRKLYSTAALTKVALDQLVFAPVFLPACVTAVHVMNGRPLKNIRNELRLKYRDILLMNYKIWPAVQIMNFGIVPIKYQVILIQTVGILWNTYLSYKVQLNHSGEKM